MPGEEGTIGFKAMEAMQQGRRTWVESRLLFSLMLSRIPVNRPKAIDEINEVSDTFEMAGSEAELLCTAASAWCGTTLLLRPEWASRPEFRESKGRHTRFG